MPATGALIGTPASISDRRRRAHRRHRGRAVRRQHLGHEAQRVGELLLARHAPAAAPARRAAVADLAALGRADAAGLAVGLRAACCSGACSASWSSGPSVSSSWSMRGMPRVTTLSTWVSPRWNRPEPWAVGRTPTSADERAQVGRAAAVDAHALVDDPLADELLGQAADGLLDLPLAALELGALAAELLDDLGVGGVGGGVALGLVGDGDGLGRAVGRRRSLDRGRTRRRRSRAAASYGDRARCTPALATSSRCSVDRLLDPDLAGLEARRR